MSSRPETGPQIVWRLRLAAPPSEVFALLATDEGRSRFWAEQTEERDDTISFRFPNGEQLESRVLESIPPLRFSITYFGGSAVTFELAEVGGGTELTLTESDLAAEEVEENRAGWVSVLLNLKAVADFGVDLRNHDPARTWSDGFVDN